MTDEIDDNALDDAFNSMNETNSATPDGAEGDTDSDTGESNAADNSGVAPQVDLMAEMAAAMEVAATEDAQNPEMNDSPASTDAGAIAAGISGSDVDIDTLLKVPVSLSIEVGRTQMPLSELLETQEGSIIELERLLDEPLDILVNGALIAHGVVVLANERFGIQITDIISMQERARNL